MCLHVTIYDESNKNMNLTKYSNLTDDELITEALVILTNKDDLALELLSRLMDMKDELGQRLLKLGNSGMSDMLFNRYASDYHNAFDAADFNKIAELDAQSGLMSCYATDLTPASTMQILQNYKMAAAAAGFVGAFMMDRWSEKHPAQEDSTEEVISEAVEDKIEDVIDNLKKED